MGQGTADAEAVAAAAEREHAASAQLVDRAAQMSSRPDEWQNVLEGFRGEVKAVNKQIDMYNLAVPASWMGKRRLDVVQELQRALREAPQRSEELKSQKNTASRGEGGAASRAAASGSLYEGALGGAPAGLALHAGPTFPSIFDSLASALFSR